MANIQHSSLSDPQLHEPKGISTATAGSVYRANGSGSGTWAGEEFAYTTFIDDVSTASTIYIPMHRSCEVIQVVTCLEGPITGADATLTVRNALNNSMGTITIAHTSSAIGDIDTLAPVSNNTVNENEYISIETDGASTDAQKVWVTVHVRRNA